MTDNEKIKMCRSDFRKMLHEAIAKAGGAVPQKTLDRMSLTEAIDLLAQNGIRMVYLPDKTVSAISVKDAKERARTFIREHDELFRRLV